MLIPVIKFFSNRYSILTFTYSIINFSLFQVSSYLPKTSYLKAIDIWLLFCTSVIFLIIVFHVLIDIIAYNSEEDEMKKGWTVPLKGSAITNANILRNRKLKLKVSIRRLILISRTTVLCIFVLFNVIYWSVIVV